MYSSVMKSTTCKHIVEQGRSLNGKLNIILDWIHKTEASWREYMEPKELHNYVLCGTWGNTSSGHKVILQKYILHVSLWQK